MKIFARWFFVILLSAVIGSAGDYFPVGVLGDSSSQHRFRSDWYSKHLTAMREPSLWDVSGQDSAMEVYRFLWLRSFHHPISVRLTVRHDGTGLLTSKETDGKGGYDPGKLIRNVTATLSREQTDWFRDRAEGSGLWKLPTKQPEAAGTVGLDGAQWIIETRKGGRYHIVDRWSPPADDPVHALGTTLMINLAHFKLLPEDVY
jgi:hypothetical protein